MVCMVSDCCSLPFGMTLFSQLRGKEVVVECKFDGDRIQVHKNGNDIHFFSRFLPSKCAVDFV